MSTRVYKLLELCQVEPLLDAEGIHFYGASSTLELHYLEEENGISTYLAGGPLAFRAIVLKPFAVLCLALLFLLRGANPVFSGVSNTLQVLNERSIRRTKIIKKNTYSSYFFFDSLPACRGRGAMLTNLPRAARISSLGLPI